LRGKDGNKIALPVPGKAEIEKETVPGFLSGNVGEDLRYTSGLELTSRDAISQAVRPDQ